MATTQVEAKFLSTLQDGSLLFRHVRGREELGRMPEYHVELLRKTDQVGIEAKQLLGTKASVEIEVEDGKFRYVNGIVSRFERGGARGRYDVYRVELRPWLWHLTLSADCRIFQEMTALEAIEKVFAGYSSAGPLEKNVQATLRKRP